MTDIAKKLEDAGIKRPLNWDEMGSSEKDLWEERMLRALERRPAATRGRKQPGR